ncbi:HAMP domain-containing histidine kinase [Limibaculum sp. M0105]|uniref:histidine kinase n=1 Tax=Thermohalobaculum xanthum TaxID=2753746 RepID=A0A8J7SE10_9RHOB|nr:HAMP domain-containing sensor histidine kinase [Thermohalobaculum xanthum]MBK0399196.1 HAMP domain-containing histidine kinase [Thermohalobaculum xanthum]
MLRNATTRLVGAHLLLVAVATGLVLGFVYWRAGGVIDAEQRAVVEAELRGMADDYQRGGLIGLAAAVERRLDRTGARDEVYLLADVRGTRIAGNLGAWPPGVVPGSGWVTLELYRLDAKQPTTISAVSVRLRGGERLLVGRDVAARAAFDATLLRALGWGLAAMALMALGTGWLLSRLILRRIDGIAATAQAIVGGALDRRIETTGTGNEFDRLADTLNAMLDRNSALVGDLRMVTDSLAHDLRSPLGRLSRHLEAALDQDLPAEARKDLIERARSEADGVLKMASALLDISRIEAGLAAEQFETLDLGDLANDVADLYSAAAADRGVVLQVFSDDGFEVSAHPQLLAQALANLLDNAVRYAPAGTAVRVALTTGSDSVSLCVADRGPGIPEAERERVRQRFARLDPSRGTDGAGLGLALVDAVARLHGAQLTLEDNAPGLKASLVFPRGPARRRPGPGPEADRHGAAAPREPLARPGMEG